MTGSRPTNSGIRPYFKRSLGSTSQKISPVLRSSSEITLAPKPIELDRLRAEMIFSSPLKGSAAYEQDVAGVDLQELLLRVLAPTRVRSGGDGAETTWGRSVEAWLRANQR
jgi:hypothetical protein